MSTEESKVLGLGLESSGLKYRTGRSVLIGLPGRETEVEVCCMSLKENPGVNGKMELTCYSGPDATGEVVGHYPEAQGWRRG